MTAPQHDRRLARKATGMPAPRPTQPDHPLRYYAARNGTEPAEALSTRDRHRLIAELHSLQWADHDIAAHTRMTTYTTARIRGQLGLAPNQARAMEGAA